MSVVASSIRQPSWRFVFGHPSHFLAFGFGVGLMPFAPGTFGTLLALPLFWLLNPHLTPLEWVLGLIGLFWTGVWACSRTGRALGVHDHGGMVLDETVAFLAVLFLTPDTLLWQAFAFLLFRLFDILKPPPIRYVDRKVKGGLGVMLDDLVAALFALLCLAGWKTMMD